MRRCLLLVVLLLLIPSPALSQDGRGVIVIGTTSGVDTIGPLNPLRCADPVCERLSSLLFPHLIGVDPASGMFADSGDPSGLANGWEIDGSTYIFHLREDLVWSDGVPITAYDVFYTFLASVSDQVSSPYYHDKLRALVRAVVPIDESTVVFVMKVPSCSALYDLNLPIIPAHRFDPGFTRRAAAAFSDSAPLEDQYDEWLGNEPWDSYSTIRWFPPDSAGAVTGGMFEFAEFWPGRYFRLQAGAGDPVLSYIPVLDDDTRVNWFLSGDLTLIENPPLDRRDDIRAAADVQIYEYPSRTWYGISLNLADPREPRSAFDEDGNLLEQGQHPILGDVRVRRALQLAIDIPALIEATVEGNGTILASSQIPASPAYDPDLAPVGYDLAEARRLLNEAGWKDINRDGFLECDSCLYAQPGSSFSLSLLYDSRVPSGLVDLLQWQFVRLGVSVYSDPGSSNPTDQRYDMYLFTRIESYPVNPDQSILFTQAQDIISRGSNYGSYTNPQVEDLFEQARTTCDADEQADLYREAQVILQEDQPYLWLFVANDMVAVRGGVQGFEPYPNAPFWNMHEWSVTR